MMDAPRFMAIERRAILPVAPRRVTWPIAYGAFALLCALVHSVRAQEEVHFTSDVRPILATHCFVCHGADDEARKADLRLDTAAGATADLGGEKAITPGNLAESELITRIFSKDDDERMPPKGMLTAREKETLRQWIAQGAVYEKHWAFVPPVPPRLPTVVHRGWIRNVIDPLVLARLEREGIEPSPEADRTTLVRRLYLDLTGLPPTPAQAASFLADRHPLAYQRLVDRLLASPHYGERWARLWLDLARYADTNGYEKDRPRSMWAYRDWVIGALNADMPFDQFTIVQIAGDMLPGATCDQRIASGFHRNTMLNEEGGVDVEQYRYESIIDRVNTTGTVWLGMTVRCARCHSHKYDPLTQKEYYQMFAFFNNADEPSMPLPNADIARRRAACRTQIDRLERELATHWPATSPGQNAQQALDRRLSGWVAEKRQHVSHWNPLRAVKTSSKKGTTFTVLDDLSLLTGGNRPNNDVYTLEFETGMRPITALRLEVLPDDSLPNGGPGWAPISIGEIVLKGDFLLSEFAAAAGPLRRTAQLALDDSAASAGPSPGGQDGGPSDPLAKIAFGKPTASYAMKGSSPDKTLDGVLDTGWRIGHQAGRENHIVFPLAKPIDGDGPTRLVVTLQQIYIQNMVLGRFRISATSDPLPIVSSGLPAAVEAALLVPDGQQTDANRQTIRRQFLLTAPELATWRKQIDQLRLQMPHFETTLVMQERKPENARVTHRHHRGEYLKPREVVQPGTPAMLHPLPEGALRNRLTFAKWLVDRKNPLVARVVINRQWQALFGRGIVRTTEDFGMQSSPPTHPKLLDLLATEFMRRDWSRKQMHRMIVTSATYRQRSIVTPELLARDPENRLLARGPRFRVSAEMVRDIALTASGLLNPNIGGPSVFPPQPEGVTGLSYGTLAWKTDHGGNRYRRGLYTFTKRTSPYAMFGTFDAPSGETCVVRRGRSNTPLQALTALNDVAFMEAAQALARQELTHGPPETDRRIADMVRRLLTRGPDAAELAAIGNFYRRQLDRFQAHELDAAAMTGVQAAACPAGIDLDAWAAWTTVARAVLNFDETITKD